MMMDRNWGPGFSSIFNKAVLDIHLGRFKDAGTFLHVIPLFAKHLCTAPSKRCSKACASIALPLRSRQLSAAFFQPLPSHTHIIPSLSSRIVELRTLISLVLKLGVNKRVLGWPWSLQSTHSAGHQKSSCSPRSFLFGWCSHLASRWESWGQHP